jgi:hypothetical protein
MWIYEQSSGLLSHDGEPIAAGHGGYEQGRNNPAMEQVAGVGPVPRGTYDISQAFDSPSHGPCVMQLTPTVGTMTYRRGGFLIHGDSNEYPGLTSHGCIILPGPVRRQIARSDDRKLMVI